MVELQYPMDGRRKAVFSGIAGIQVTARPLFFMSLHWGHLVSPLIRQDTKNGFQHLNGKKFTIQNIFMRVPFLSTKCRISGLIFGAFMMISIKKPGLIISKTRVALHIFNSNMPSGTHWALNIIVRTIGASRPVMGRGRHIWRLMVRKEYFMII